MVVVMVWPFRGSRLARRRWLCLPIGIFAGLVLSGAWMDTQVFWWPLDGPRSVTSRCSRCGGSSLLEELVGLVACWWVVGQFDLCGTARSGASSGAPGRLKRAP